MPVEKVGVVTPLPPSEGKGEDQAYRSGYADEPVFEKIKDFNLVTYMKNSVMDYWNDKPAFATEMLSGITLAIVMVPESVAFSFMAHIEPYAGLSATFWIGVMCGFFGGRPGMISGCAGAMAVVLGDIMKDTGPLAAKSEEERRGHLFMCVLLIISRRFPHEFCCL